MEYCVESICVPIIHVKSISTTIPQSISLTPPPGHLQFVSFVPHVYEDDELWYPRGDNYRSGGKRGARCAAYEEKDIAVLRGSHHGNGEGDHSQEVDDRMRPHTNYLLNLLNALENYQNMSKEKRGPFGYEMRRPLFKEMHLASYKRLQTPSAKHVRPFWDRLQRWKEYKKKGIN